MDKISREELKIMVLDQLAHKMTLTVLMTDLEHTFNLVGIYLTYSELEEMRLRLDPHETGLASLDSFADLCVNMMSTYSKYSLIDELNKLDYNKDGKISIIDLRYFMKKDGSDILTA